MRFSAVALVAVIAVAFPTWAAAPASKPRAAPKGQPSRPAAQSSSTTAQASPGASGGAEVLAKLKQFETYTPKDEFSSATGDSQLIGTHFRIVSPVMAQGRSDGGVKHAYWKYDPDAQTLKMDLIRGMWIANSGARFAKQYVPKQLMFVGFSLEETQTNAGQYPASNAYGAQFSVARRLVRQYGISFNDGDVDAVELMRAIDRAATTIRIGPDEGRRVTAGLRLIVEGTITRGSYGAAACGDDREEPTFNNRVDTTRHFCLAFARLERMAFETGDGQVLWQQTSGY